MFYDVLDTKKKEYTLKRKALSLFYSLLLYNILLVVSVLLIIFIDKIIIIKYLGCSSIMKEIHNTTTEINKLNPIKIILLAPLIEEIIFRLIIKPSKYKLFLFFIVLSFFFINGNFYEVKYFSINFLFFVSINIIAYFLLQKYSKSYENTIIKYNRTSIIISIVAFGLVHMTNIKNFNLSLILFYPFYVLPQFISGYFITNLRVKFGFVWGLLLHILINFLGSLSLFF